MDSKDFYTYWRYIEERAFLPDRSNPKSKDIGKWLNQFLLFLNNLYEKDYGYIKIKPKNNKFRHKICFEHDITCKFSIQDNLSKFSFLIEWKKTSLLFEYDKQYTCEFDYLDEHCSGSNKFNEDELKEVLMSQIHHPAIHCHIDAKDLDNDEGKRVDVPHGVRIGPANKNPFLFLYQLAFQFLYRLKDKYGLNKKEEELKRLTRVIFENKKEMEISPGVLFGIKNN